MSGSKPRQSATTIGSVAFPQPVTSIGGSPESGADPSLACPAASGCGGKGPNITELRRDALVAAQLGTWDLADRLELAWLNAHVAPHIDDEEWWREGIPNPYGTVLMALRIVRGGGRDGETVVHWGFVFPCLSCDLMLNFEEVLSCDVCGGAGHVSDPERTCVVTDLDGLVIEEWPDA